MNKGTVLATALLLTAALAGCKKYGDANADVAALPTDRTPAAQPASAVPAQADDASAPTDEAKAKLDYATMEDGYINDANAQWAVSAKASSSFGSANNEPADSHSSNTPWQATGPVNGDAWTNNQQDIGFDWLQLDYERPVSATAVRAVLDDESVAAITKIELIGTDGAAHTVWSGVSDTKKDERGARTWFVRTVDATPYPVKSVKLSFANNVKSGYKEVDAVQLVGK